MTQMPGPLPPPPIPPSPTYSPIFYPPPARGGGLGGFTRAVLTTLAVSAFGFSLTLNVYLLLFSGLFSGGPVHKTTVREGDHNKTIAVVPLSGVITDATAAEINQILGEVEGDKNVKAVVLELNTPGGGVTPSDQIYDRLLRLKKEKGLTLVVSMGALATSGGYYVACAADAVVAQRTTWTGNIGVLLPRYNVHKLADQYGVEDTTIKSAGSTFKDAGSPFKPDTPEANAYFQALADDAFGVFKGVVAAGRAMDARTVAQVANGKIYNGPEAQRLKLVDRVGYLDDAIDLAATKAGLSPAAVHAVRYEKTVGLFESLSRNSSQSDGRLGGRAGGVSVTLDRALLDDLLSPRPMYLWRGE